MNATVLLITFAALFCPVALAQTPATPPAGTETPAQQPQRPRGPRPNPTNIKALPKDTTGDQIALLMHQYTGDLGVGCGFCHAAPDPTTHRSNYALDTNPMKETARFMITMTADLNEKYIAEMPNRMYADPITCGTCHRGEKHPSIFVPTPRQPAPPAAPTPPPPLGR